MNREEIIKEAIKESLSFYGLDKDRITEAVIKWIETNQNKLAREIASDIGETIVSVREALNRLSINF